MVLSRWLLADGSVPFRRGVLWIYVALLAFNVAVWLWTLVAFRQQPVLLGTALLAYAFGLRHAVDADHIAAIDNATRKLLQEGRSALGVGPFFAMGHSSVVVVMSTLISLAAVSLSSRFGLVKVYGGIVSTAVSAMFLLLLAAANLAIFISVHKTFRAMRRGEGLAEEDLDLLLNQRGLLARLLRPLFRLISRSWHLYPIGILFGLGFDTSTEIALFGLSVHQAHQGLPLISLLCLPMLFAAGMILIDTTDGMLMLGAYRWAFVRPVRKLYYNMSITLISVIVAVIIGGTEVMGLLVDKFSLHGPFWQAATAVSTHFGLLGYFIIGVFVVSWIVSLLIYRLKRYDEITVEAAR